MLKELLNGRSGAGWLAGSKCGCAGWKNGDSGNFSGNQALKFYKSMSEELFGVRIILSKVKWVTTISVILMMARSKCGCAGQKKGDSGNFSGNQALKFYKYE